MFLAFQLSFPYVIIAVFWLVLGSFIEEFRAQVSAEIQRSPLRTYWGYQSTQPALTVGAIWDEVVVATTSLSLVIEGLLGILFVFAAHLCVLSFQAAVITLRVVAPCRLSPESFVGRFLALNLSVLRHVLGVVLWLTFALVLHDRLQFIYEAREARKRHSRRELSRLKEMLRRENTSGFFRLRRRPGRWKGLKYSQSSSGSKLRKLQESNVNFRRSSKGLVKRKLLRRSSWRT